MTTQTTKVRNGNIVLPEEIRKSWKGADVFIDASPNIISIKRLTKPSLTFKKMLDEFQEAAKKTKLSENEVNKAVRRVRDKIYR